MYVDHEKITITLENTRERESFLGLLLISKEILNDDARKGSVSSIVVRNTGATEMCELSESLSFAEKLIDSI